MKARVLLAPSLAVIISAAAIWQVHAAPPTTEAPPPTSYYVDFSAGHDDSDGLSANTP